MKYIDLCPKLGFTGHHGVITVYTQFLNTYGDVIFQ